MTHKSRRARINALQIAHVILSSETDAESEAHSPLHRLSDEFDNVQQAHSV